MFKLASMITYPAQPQQAAQNQFKRYAVAMPAECMAILQGRIFAVLLRKLSGEPVPHHLDGHNLISLDNLFVRLELDEAHNMIVDSRHLSMLRRFLQAERQGIYGAKTVLVPQLDNEEYWGLLTDLLVAVERPTLVVNLSFGPWVKTA